MILCYTVYTHCSSTVLLVHLLLLSLDLKIAELYADAAKHYPKNQEILTHLFMAYVRVGDTAKQQQVAAKLCKFFPNNGPYQCWRVMSVMIQVSGGCVSDIE